MSNIDFQNGFALGVVSKRQVQSSAEFNIAYGDTEPDDTSKLWIKANEPESVVFGSDFEGVESIEILSARLPTAYNSMGCARVGNKIYLFGGYSGSGALNTINVFDAETQTIETLGATLPSTNYDMGCAKVGTKIYLFGGYSGGYLNTISVFDTETETITTLGATLPIAMSKMGCVSVGTKIYLFGGGAGYNYNYKTINMFDTETETITTLNATLPAECYGIGCASIGNTVYLFGGVTEYRYSNTYLNTISIFDTTTETITTLSATLPEKCHFMGCAAIGTKIYLFGGYSGSGALNTINVFDTGIQTITTLSATLPSTNYRIGCTSVGMKIYLFGGTAGSYLNTINQFLLTHDLAQNNIEIITDYKNFFNIVNTHTMKVEIGVDSVLIGNTENQAENCEAYLYQNESWVQI